MSARLHHSAVFKDIDAVGVPDGRQTVSNQEGGPPFGCSIQGSLDDGLAFCVQRRGGLV